MTTPRMTACRRIACGCRHRRHLRGPYPPPPPSPPPSYLLARWHQVVPPRVQAKRARVQTQVQTRRGARRWWTRSLVCSPRCARNGVGGRRAAAPPPRRPPPRRGRRWGRRGASSLWRLARASPPPLEPRGPRRAGAARVSPGAARSRWTARHCSRAARARRAAPAGGETPSPRPGAPSPRSARPPLPSRSSCRSKQRAARRSQPRGARAAASDAARLLMLRWPGRGAPVLVGRTHTCIIYIIDSVLTYVIFYRTFLFRAHLW